MRASVVIVQRRQASGGHSRRHRRKKELIAACGQYPLFRALRVDTHHSPLLKPAGAYLRVGGDEIPAMRMIRMTPQELKRRAEHFSASCAPNCSRRSGDRYRGWHFRSRWRLAPSQALPRRLFESPARATPPTETEQRLRRAPAGVSVIARVEEERLILDLRTVFPGARSSIGSSPLRLPFV